MPLEACSVRATYGRLSVVQRLGPPAIANLACGVHGCAPLFQGPRICEPGRPTAPALAARRRPHSGVLLGLLAAVDCPVAASVEGRLMADCRCRLMAAVLQVKLDVELRCHSKNFGSAAGLAPKLEHVLRRQGGAGVARRSRARATTSAPCAGAARLSPQPSRVKSRSGLRQLCKAPGLARAGLLSPVRPQPWREAWR